MSESTQGGGWLGRAIVVMIVWVLLAGAAYLVLSLTGVIGGGGSSDSNPGASSSTTAGTPHRAPDDQATPSIEVGIAYGTEKKRWLQWAVEAFADTDAGHRIQVNLIPMGSLEGARAVLGGDERVHVWSPASSMYRPVFEQEWQLQHSGSPVAKQETLALTPMVFVMWKERYDGFVGKYEGVSFKTIAQALAEPGGWDGIAGRAEWGFFKFGHTHPNRSNSGLMNLVLMAYDFHDKSRGLAMADILAVPYQQWMVALERGVSGLSNSTGNMMREMVLKGPSAFDALCVYESVAIDYLKNAEGRWSGLQVAYPGKNMWNDNPYYILETPWSDKAHQDAAQTFLDFLMSEPAQLKALEHGFRPGNAAVGIKFDDSPFVKYASYGLRVELPQVCENPPPEVLTNLLAGWQRSVGR